MIKAICQLTMIHSKKADSDNAADLRVIGVGLPRTGTTSLQAALEILGFGPCHHMAELIDKPDQSKQFIRAYDKDKVDFHALLKGYGSAVGAPAADFYKEIREVYPQAKLVLTVRDSAEKWFESFDSTIRLVSADKTFYYLIYLAEVVRLQILVCQKGWQKWTSEYGRIGPWFYDQYNARVINENKEGEVLVFNVKEGWAPLCKFLGVDIPQNIPFPKLNETQHLQRQIILGTIVGSFLWAFVGIGIAIAFYFLIRLTM
jgi:sulfotransferase family protein